MNDAPERALVIRVQLLSDCWHGTGDWPPSPFRLFQALICGAYGARWTAEDTVVAKDAAFRWLETLPAPLIGRPAKLTSDSVQYFVPNNDLDAVGNDPRRSGEIRTPKKLRTAVLAAPATIAYAWRFSGDDVHAQQLVTLCERLHTFGRGLDAAFASARVVAGSELDDACMEGGLRRCEPSDGPGGSATRLACPSPGSLESLKQRFRETGERLRNESAGAKVAIRFKQPSKALSRVVAYDVSPVTLVFELQELTEPGRLYPYRLEVAARLAIAIRDLAFGRLSTAMGREAELERAVLGRMSGPGEQRSRIRVIPLPSLGTPHTDPSIRRVVVQVPADCPVEASDIRWALAGQRVPSLSSAQGESAGAARLVESGGDAMLWKYGFVGEPCDRWRTVTPAVLPVHLRSGRRTGSERSQFEDLAALSVADAVRHAGIPARVREVRCQREPYFTRGKPANEFARDRFESGRLRHVELVLNEACQGPLIIGDGRWLGLGLLYPVRTGEADEVSSAQPSDSIEDIAEADQSDASDADETPDAEEG